MHDSTRETSTQTDTNELNSKSSVTVQATEDFQPIGENNDEEIVNCCMNPQESKSVKWE